MHGCVVSNGGHRRLAGDKCGCQYVPHMLQRLIIHEFTLYHHANILPPGLPKPLPSLARASRLKRSPSLQNVNVALTGLNCRCSWCLTDMRAICLLGPHVSDPTAPRVKSLKQRPHSRPMNLFRRQLSIRLSWLIAIRPLY